MDNSTRLSMGVVAAFLLFGLTAQAMMLPPGMNVVRGRISAVDLKTDRLVVAGRTIYFNLQTHVVQETAGDKLRPLSREELCVGQPVEVRYRLTGGRCLAHLIEAMDAQEMERREKGRVPQYQ
ncbi:MAG: DUF5666 domain-containing protein [Pseudomonadota bacterium]